jgi:Nucleotidyltransferase domain
MAEPLTRERFQEIVTAILSVSQPAAIILFGSYARDQVHEFSDVDLLVIRDAEFREGESRSTRSRMTQPGHRQPMGLPQFSSGALPIFDVARQNAGHFPEHRDWQ